MDMRSTWKFAAALMLSVAGGVAAAPPQVGTQAPGYYRMMVGKMEVTALSDGTARIPIETQLFGLNAVEARTEFRRWGRPMPYEISINGYLINTGSKLILIDAGLGTFLEGRAGGHLLKNLEAAGYSASQVDAVLISHFHIDHVHGLSKGGAPNFPNATVYLSSPEKDYWLSSKAEKSATVELRQFIPPARAALKPYLDAGRVQTFEDGAQLFEGVTARVTPGHSAGHAVYNISSGEAEMTFIGDLVHAVEVQFARPQIGFIYDSDYGAAATQRKQSFQRFAKAHALVAASHLSFPGIGHIRSKGPAFEWVPAPYSTAKLK